MFLLKIPDYLVTPLISSGSILLGSLLGAYFSWIISKKTTIKNIKEQHRIMEINWKNEEFYNYKKVCVHANIIRLDICTAIFQSIRTLKSLKNDEEFWFYPTPINKNYSNLVASLSDKCNLKELSYIYQLYGLIEKLNFDILNYNIIDKKNRDIIISGYEAVLEKIYGENRDKVLCIDDATATYQQLYLNNIIKTGYKDILTKLDELCAIEQKELGIEKQLYNEWQ